MEVPETNSVAEAVGRAFADPSRRVSAHVGVDTDSTVRYVSDDDTAWAAPGANADGLQIELAGRAGQTTGQWADAPSRAILERAAQQVATWCRAYGIPPLWLTDAQLADGRTRGVIGHADASRAFKLSDHTDPGRAFPRASFLARVKSLIGSAVARPQTRPVKAPTSRIRLSVDGIFGPRTKARLQQWAGVKVDSVLSANDWKAIQRTPHHRSTGRGRGGRSAGVRYPTTHRTLGNRCLRAGIVRKLAQRSPSSSSQSCSPAGKIINVKLPRHLLRTSAAVAATAVIGGLGTDVKSRWYSDLEKPTWQPPGAAFGPAWTTLYALMALASARTLDRLEPQERRGFATAFGANLVLNAGWSWLFFTARRPDWALAEIVLLEASNLDLTRRAAKVDSRAAAMFVPYAGWVAFATALNAAIAHRNPEGEL